MEGSYPSGGGAPTHLMGYFQGVPGYNVQQGQIMSNSLPNKPRSANAVSIWVGDLDSYMDETFLRQAVTACGWGPDITRIKVVRDHSSGGHLGYGFFDAASIEAAQRLITLGSGMPIPGTNRCWRLNMGRNSAMTNDTTTLGNESNVYVGNLELSVTDYQLMSVFRPRYASVRHAKVVCNEYGQSKGFGFVRFGNPVDAERAVIEMQSYVFNQKPIKLSPANGRSRQFNGAQQQGQGYGVGQQQQQQQQQQQARPSSGNQNHLQRDRGGLNPSTSTNKRPRQLMSPDDPNNTTIFIGGTAAHITEELLWREFSAFGEVEAVRVPVNKTGFAFVRFRFRESAQRAIDEVSRTHFVSLNPVKPVRVEWASEQIAAQPQSGPYSFDVNSATNNIDGVRPVAFNTPVNPVSEGDVTAEQVTNNGGVEPTQPSNNSSGLVVRSIVKNGATPEDAAAETQDGGSSAVAAANAPQTTVTETANGSTVNEAMNSENERPSKRVAVDRSIYTVPESTDRSVSKKEPTVDDKEKNSPEEPPAMQFSWLNAATTQGSSDNE